MLKIKTKDAVGSVLCHDITKIVPGEFKGVAFKKGHRVQESDIEELLKIGKDHLYVWDCDENQIHEDEAAKRIARAVGGTNIDFTDPREGKVNLVAAERSLLKVNVNTLAEINSIEEIVVATRHTNSLVEKGDTLAGTRVIPLVVDKNKIEDVEKISTLTTNNIIELKPLQAFKTGVIVTGNEVFHGRIQDKFGPVIIEKLKKVGCTDLQHVYLPDDPELISTKIQELTDQGIEMIVVTGGMSVDPDDATPGAIRRTGADVVTYGTPLFPGAMFLLAYLGDVPIMGLPGCVMYNKATVFDIVLPRVLTGEKITRQDLTSLGHGGLCLDCVECRFPNCSFGKGN